MSSTWTSFKDMHSGGGCKQPPYEYIYIEAPEAEARVIFYKRFGHNPDRVTCTCCGEDYAVYGHKDLLQATGFERGCASLATPRVDGRYVAPDDPWFHDHYYIEPADEVEAGQRGYSVSKTFRWGNHVGLDEYIRREDVLVIRASEIQPEERTGDVPTQGYVWAD